MATAQKSYKFSAMTRQADRVGGSDFAEDG